MRIGPLVNLHHGVGGVVYALNQTALLVKDFTYDGGGPDAFFWAGTSELYIRIYQDKFVKKSMNFTYLNEIIHS